MPEVKEAQISYDICGIYMIYIWDLKKNDMDELIYETEIASQT